MKFRGNNRPKVNSVSDRLMSSISVTIGSMPRVTVTDELEAMYTECPYQLLSLRSSLEI